MLFRSVSQSRYQIFIDPLYKRYAVTQLLGSHCLYASGFRFYFTPLPGFFSPFPVTIPVHISVSPWRVVPPASHKVSRVSWYSGSCSMHLLALTRLSLSLARFPNRFCFTPALVSSPQPRTGFPIRFGLCPVRSPLLGVSLLIPFPTAT